MRKSTHLLVKIIHQARFYLLKVMNWLGVVRLCKFHALSWATFYHWKWVRCLLFCIQDLEGWCNLAAFELAEDSPSPECHQFRLESSALQELSKGSKGELIPISPGGITPPSILSHRSRRHVALSPDTNSSMTPKSTPVKALPFSPSQVGSAVRM